MRILIAALLFQLISVGAHALVDMRNANYSETWVDLDVPNAGYSLKVQRTYNSRSIFNGIFGFGWCSDFETKLDVTPQNTLKIRECGAGSEIEFTIGGKDPGPSDTVVKQILAEVKKRNKSLDDRYFANLEKEIKSDPLLRDEFIRQLNLQGTAKSGSRYTAVGRANEHVSVRGTNYVRTLPSGATQTFNKEGLLIELKDPNGNTLKFNYSGPRLTKVTEGSGAALQIKFAKGGKYVSEISGPGGLKASYQHDGEKLVLVNNAWKNSFRYEYDELYNLTKVSYPDGKFIALSYNKDKDWVTGFRDREGCIETYKYAQNKADPLNNYSSEVVKKCGSEVTNRSNYEFWHKTKADGTRYLTKSRAEINGVISETEYHPDHGRPTRHLQDGILVTYQYSSDGLLSRKIEAGRETLYKYDSKCMKPSQVAVKTFREVPTGGKGRTPTKVDSKVVTTKFQYEPRSCNLATALNSDGQFAKLNYDRKGRISRIEDQSKKVVNISYEERFGKPLVVDRPGLGKIRFKYKANGELEKIESDDEPLVAVQLANMFSNLLEIIGPGTTESPI